MLLQLSVGSSLAVALTFDVFATDRQSMTGSTRRLMQSMNHTGLFPLGLSQSHKYATNLHICKRF